MIPLIPAPEGSVELNEQRGLRSKTFSFGGRKRRFIARLQPVHVPDDVDAWKAQGQFEWLDVNTDATFRLGAHHPTNCWYTCDLSVPDMTVVFNSKRGDGDVEIILRKINDIDVATLGLGKNVRIDGNKVWVDDILPDLDVYFEFRPGQVRVFKILKGPQKGAPFSMEWEIIRGADKNVIIDVTPQGVDNHNRTNPKRDPEVRKIRRIEMIASRTPDDPDLNPGRITFFNREEFTGRTAFVDLQTKIPELRDEFEYPVLIDADITETIAADVDDGNDDTYDSQWHFDSTFFAIRKYGADYRNGGVRFTSIALDQATTIDPGTVIKMYLHASGGTLDFDCFADDVDDAPVFSDASLPSNITKTTATTNFTTAGDYQEISVDVEAIIQEIVDRGSWASGNDIRFLLENNDTSGHGHSIADFGHATLAEPSLEINFTAAAAGGGVLRQPHQEAMKSLVTR